MGEKSPKLVTLVGFTEISVNLGGARSRKLFASNLKLKAMKNWSCENFVYRHCV
jgi:hypothetical protein